MATRKIAIELRGFEELSRTFNSLKRGIQGKIIRPALREGAKIVRDAARAKVPVRTGRLKKSLRVRAMKRSRVWVGYRVTTGTKDELGISNRARAGYYPFVVEYGGVVGGARRSVRVGRRRRVVKEGGRKIPARPFLRPAVDENAQRVFSMMASQLQAGIDRAVQEKGRDAVFDAATE